ncbi:MAG: type II secretion system protein, partial [Patescibacteria group bacterium]
MRKKNKQGFSLIEIIAVVAIGLILISVVLFSFSSFRNSKIIEVSADQVLSVINEARVKAVSSEDYSRFGVHLEIGRVVFFKGDIFTEPNLSNIETALSPLVEISDISLNGGGADVVFQKLTGKTGNYGSLRIRLKSDNSKYKTISV